MISPVTVAWIVFVLLVFLAGTQQYMRLTDKTECTYSFPVRMVWEGGEDANPPEWHLEKNDSFMRCLP